jgi:hypothetical protein
MVCLVRDLRGVFASMEKIFRKNRHNPEGPDNTALIQNMTVFQRINYWNSTQPIGLALERTLDSIYRGVDRNILFIRYEDLCVAPQAVLNQFYDFVGLERFNHDFNNIHKEVYENCSHFGIFGEHSIQSKLSPNNIYSWKSIIGPKMSDMIISNNKWFFEYFNYRE